MNMVMRSCITDQLLDPVVYVYTSTDGNTKLVITFKTEEEKSYTPILGPVDLYEIRVCHCNFYLLQTPKHLFWNNFQLPTTINPIVPDRQQMGQICPFLRSVFCSLWLGEQKLNGKLILKAPRFYKCYRKIRKPTLVPLMVKLYKMSKPSWRQYFR